MNPFLFNLQHRLIFLHQPSITETFATLIHYHSLVLVPFHCSSPSLCPCLFTLAVHTSLSVYSTPCADLNFYNVAPSWWPLQRPPHHSTCLHLSPPPPFRPVPPPLPPPLLPCSVCFSSSLIMTFCFPFTVFGCMLVCLYWFLICMSVTLHFVILFMLTVAVVNVLF
eukprot:GILI01002992.1.p1 GENE.GILI01002992.1~~GILI01002992.1.p1  ORF type:complete len:167 (+),score=1.19 GILI01002992.1:665-1165(+)